MYVLTLVFLIYGKGGDPITAAAVTSDYTSQAACEAARDNIAKNIKDGALTVASCNPR